MWKFIFVSFLLVSANAFARKRSPLPEVCDIRGKVLLIKRNDWINPAQNNRVHLKYDITLTDIQASIYRKGEGALSGRCKRLQREEIFSIWSDLKLPNLNRKLKRGDIIQYNESQPGQISIPFVNILNP